MHKQYHVTISVLFFFSIVFLFTSSALANMPILWGIYGVNASFYAGSISKSISFIVVSLIEFAILYYYLSISWQKALCVSLVANLISTGAGVLLTIPFILPEFGPLLFPAAVSAIFFKVKAPPRFATLAFLATIIGAVGALLNYSITPPQSHVRIGIALIMPLFLGFGITFLIEGETTKRLLKNSSKNIWKGVVLANTVSYLFLIFMLPFFPSPYSRYFAARKVEEMIKAGYKETEIISVLHHMRASNLFLLGLTDNDTPVEKPYDPHTEVHLIQEFRKDNPAIANVIEKDLESLKHLKVLQK